MKCKPLHCWDCGMQIIEGEPGRYRASSRLRIVKFVLSGNAYSEHPFCVDCAEQPWTSDRLAEFKAAADAACPSFRAYRIMSVDGKSVDGNDVLVEQIMGVFEEARR